MRHVLPAVREPLKWLLPAVALSVKLCVSAPCAQAETPRGSFEYLHVESNSGDSSGGHAAICFAARCYHFQQAEEQTIRLHRDDAAEFDYRYRLLGNRTIHAARIEVSPLTYERLRSAFQERLQVQDRQYDVLASLLHDRQLLERVGNGSVAPRVDAGDAVIQIPGSAYFVVDAPGAAAPLWTGTERSATLDRLAARMRATYGSDCIERRATTLRTAVAQLTPVTEVAPVPEANRLPVNPAGFATRHRELTSGWLALEVLRAAPPLRTGSFHVPQDPDFALRPAEVEALNASAGRLADALVRLVDSERPDWGSAMLVGMARLLALEASINSGQLVLLDDFPEDAIAIPWATVSRHAETLAQVRDERRADFLAARRAFIEAPVQEEGALSVLETAGNLLIDIDRALLLRSPLRLYSGALVPTKSAIRSDWPLPKLSGATRQQALAVAHEREDKYRAALADLYHYDLISHNCVTEIFRTMEAAMTPTMSGAAADPIAVRAASTTGLGGYVEWRRTLNFIPFLSAKAVSRAYHVSESVERPSYRHIALAQMFQDENAVRVDLRESNVLTARSYERNRDDPIFLFFTDDVVLRRPLYGIANLAVGIGGSLAGLALLPVDGGATLRAGLDGALFSVPEIAFINIRKGSFAFAPRRWLGEEVGSSNQ